MANKPAAAAGISRRDFARRAALAAATAAAMPAGLFAPAAAALALAQPQQAPAPTKLSPEVQAEVEEKYQALLRQYGGRLSAEQKADAHRLLVEGQEGLEALRAFPVENSDPPATIFRPLAEPRVPRQVAKTTRRRAKRRKR
jgi:hypothetical protein